MSGGHFRKGGNVVDLQGRILQRSEQAPRSVPVPLDKPDAPWDWESWWLPEPVAAWVEAQVAANAVPRVLPIAAAMCAMATVLQGKFEVEVRPGWREPLSLFWLIAAPTGSMKSRVLDAAKRPIKAIERQRSEDAARQAKENRKTRHLYETRLKKLRSKFAAKGSLTPEDRNELNCLENDLEQLPPERAAVWTHSNINPALIPKMMQSNVDAGDYARLAVLTDEDTFLRNLLGRHSGHVDLEAVLSGYTGGAIEMVRKSVATDDAVVTRIDNAHLTMLVMTQPHVLEWARGQSVLADQGFWGRCVVTALDRGRPPPLEAPPVPDDVQGTWERLIATLEAAPGGEVVRVPPELWEAGGPLRELYDAVSAHAAAGQGGEGYAVRAVGRVCRFWAICELAKKFLRSQQSSSRASPGGARAHHEGIDLKYLISSLYFRVLNVHKALQPATPPLDRGPSVVLGWLRRSTVATVGAEVTLKRVMNANHLKKEDATDACDRLVEHGYLEQARSLRNRNGTVTHIYRVVALWGEGETDPSAPVFALRPPADMFGPPPEEEGPPPDAGDYLGADDFEEFT